MRVALLSACFLAVLLPVVSSGQSWQAGDLLVSGKADTIAVPFSFKGKLLLFSPTGQLKAMVRTMPNAAYGELAVGPSGDVFAVSDGTIAELDQTGAPTNTFARSPNFARSITVNRGGSFFASTVFGSSNVLFYSRSGQLQSTRDLGASFLGITAIDLAPDQCTLFLASNLAQVGRYDVCRGAVLPALVSGGSGPAPFSLRSLADGSVLVGGLNLQRVDASGTVIHQYGQAAGRIALAGDDSAWISSGTSISKINLTTGAALVGPVDTGLETINGMAVVGQVGAAAAASVPALSVTLLLCLAVSVAILGIWRLRQQSRARDGAR